MSNDFLRNVHEAKEKKDDATTATEHAAIILRYVQTGWLDRDDAVKKYKKFNDDHKDYWLAMTATTALAGTAADIEDERIPDSVIIGNLNQQLLFLTGENLLKDYPKGLANELHGGVYYND